MSELTNKLSQYWSKIQDTLFPWVEEQEKLVFLEK